MGSEEIADKISKVSQEAYDAGWLVEVEFSLWDLMKSSEVKDNEFRGLVKDRDLRYLEKLSEKYAGWYIWEEGDLEAKFISLDSWKGKFETWKKMRGSY